MCCDALLASPRAAASAFLRRHVAGREHQLVLRDRWRSRLSSPAAAAPLRDTLTNGRFSFEKRTWFSASNVDIQTMRPQPPATCVMCSTAAAIHAADGEIEVDAAEHLEAGRRLAREIGEAGGGIVVVLEDDAAHAASRARAWPLRARRPSAARCRDRSGRGCRSCPRASAPHPPASADRRLRRSTTPRSRRRSG